VLALYSSRDEYDEYDPAEFGFALAEFGFAPAELGFALAEFGVYKIL
jgi:hypothetical protein